MVARNRGHLGSDSNGAQLVTLEVQDVVEGARCALFGVNPNLVKLLRRQERAGRVMRVVLGDSVRVIEDYTEHRMCRGG